MPHRSIIRALLPTLLWIAQVHAAPLSALDRVHGSVTVREHVVLPQDASLTVELLDVTRTDTPTSRLARLTLPVGGRQVPLAFELPYYPADVKTAHRYVMRATLSSSSGELLFTTP